MVRIFSIKIFALTLNEKFKFSQKRMKMMIMLIMEVKKFPITHCEPLTKAARKKFQLMKSHDNPRATFRNYSALFAWKPPRHELTNWTLFRTMLMMPLETPIRHSGVVTRINSIHHQNLNFVPMSLGTMLRSSWSNLRVRITSHFVHSIHDKRKKARFWIIIWWE